MAKITLKRIGKILIGIGVLHVFNRDYVFCGCFGCQSNTWAIIIGSIFYIGLGSILMLIGEKYFKLTCFKN